MPRWTVTLRKRNNIPVLGFSQSQHLTREVDRKRWQEGRDQGRFIRDD